MEPELRDRGLWTIPNLISVLRLLAIPWFVWLLLHDDRPIAAGVLLAVLGATDWVDGYIARHFDQGSTFGKIVDPIADRVLIITAGVALIISGGMAGLAGSLEFAGVLHKIDLGFPSGYGFTAIIVSFLGRLNPIGCLIAGIVLAVTYVGGQMAQSSVHIPNSTAGIFQAMMLFFILASDILVRYRVRLVTKAVA